MSDGAQMLINTVNYTLTSQIFNIIASTSWVLAYAFIIRGIIKNKFVEMPFFAGLGNISWETLRGTILPIDLGVLFVYGDRAWLILDFYIAYSIFKYGYKQLAMEELKPHFKKLCVGIIIFWLGAFYLFYIQSPSGDGIGSLDTGAGGRSALMLNLFIAVLYFLQCLRKDNALYMSKEVAWFKMVGTACFTIFVILGRPWAHFCIYLGTIIFIVDCSYIYLLGRKKEELAQSIKL